MCAFGCASGSAGEVAAARRLFRSEEDVATEIVGGKDDGEEGCEEEEEEGEFGYDGGYEKRESVWAGVRLVGKDWGRFLGGCEREGVARF